MLWRRFFREMDETLARFDPYPRAQFLRRSFLRWLFGACCYLGVVGGGALIVDGFLGLLVLALDPELRIFTFHSRSVHLWPLVATIGGALAMAGGLCLIRDCVRGLKIEGRDYWSA